MSQAATLYDSGKGLPLLKAAQGDLINSAITFIRTFVKPKYAKDVDAIKVILVKSMAQPGLCVNWDKITSKFLKPQMGELLALEQMTGVTVLLNMSKPNEGETLWAPVLFHEFGHVMFDGGGGPNEPAAWRVELEASYGWVKEHTDEKAIFSAFVKARKKSGMYASFPAGSEASAKDAFEKLENQSD